MMSRQNCTGLEAVIPIPSADLAGRLSARVVTDSAQRRDGFFHLLTDVDEFSKICRLPTVWEAICADDSPEALRLRWYIRLLDALRLEGLNDSRLAAYVSSVMLQHHTAGILAMDSNDCGLLIQSVDILRELPIRRDYDQFELILRGANYFMVQLGLRREYLDVRSKLFGGCDADYYEAFVRCSFRAARDHRLSGEFALYEVCDLLSDHLRAVCRSISSTLSGKVQEPWVVAAHTYLTGVSTNTAGREQ